MKTLIRLAGLLALLALAKLTSGCATVRHDAQAPGPVRRRYHQAERRNERRRHRVHAPWAGPAIPRTSNACPV